MFGRGYEEIGDSKKGLILKNSGKVKVQFGNKLVDLLDSKGNINVKIPQFIKEVSSDSDITETGFYFLNGKLIAKVNDSIIEISSGENNQEDSNANLLDTLLLVYKDKELIVSPTNLVFGTNTINVASETSWIVEGDFLKTTGLGNGSFTVNCSGNGSVIVKDIFYNRIKQLYPNDTVLQDKHIKILTY